MGGFPQAQYSVHSSANPSASGIRYDPLRYGLKPGKYRVMHFGHSTQWRTREAMACVGELLRGLFPPALAVNNLGHVDIRVTHVVPHNLQPCAFAQPMAGMHGAEVSKMPFIARIDRVQISSKAVCQHALANWVSGGYVRRLTST